MPKVEYSPIALEDLKHIKDYITANWGANVAKRILKKIISDIKRLEQYPMLGVNLGRIIDVPTDYRYIYSERNYVFYILEVDKVRIIRVLNEQQNYMQKLFGINSQSRKDYDD